MRREIGVSKTGAPLHLYRIGRQAIQDAKRISPAVRRGRTVGGLFGRSDRRSHRRTEFGSSYKLEVDERFQEKRLLALRQVFLAQAALRHACCTRWCVATRIKFFA